ncbi:MAG: DUF5916 domain-containing protein [Gemmatimonadales bacterium]
MLHGLLAIALLSQGQGTAADSAPSFSGRKGELEVTAPRLDASVDVDGELVDEVWARAVRLVDFSQYSPVDGEPAVNRTEVLVWYSRTAIHFGVRAHAPPGTVRANLADRDLGIIPDDRIEIHLGTYDDGRQAFVFAANPLGIQADGALVEGARQRQPGHDAGGAQREEPDYSPDYQFDSKGRLTDFGYQLEIRIPFRSLRFQPAEVQRWSFQVIRKSAATGREDTWAPARRAAPSFLRQSGALVGLEDLSRGRVLELNPEATSTIEGAPLAGDWDYRGGRPELGANLTWGLSSNLTLNGAMNPDFSQVEADAGQVASDPRRAFFFQEKRPFFLDGLEYFATPSQVIYTRRILAPIAAAKLTGTVAGTSLGLLSAVDDRIASRTGSHNPVYNVLRIQRDLGASRLGFAYTDRIEGGDYNRVAQVDGRVVLSPLYNLSFYGGLSRTRTGGVTSTAPIWSADFQRTGRRLGLGLSFSGVSDRFEAGTGFVSQGDLVESSIQPALTFYGKPGAFVERFTASLLGQLVWSYTGFREGRQALDRRLLARGSWRIRGGWDANLTVYQFNYGFDERLFRGYGIEVPGATGLDTVAYRPDGRIPTLAWSLSINSPEIAGLSLQTYTAWGKDLNYDEFSPARILLSVGTLSFRPTRQLRVGLQAPTSIYWRASDGSKVSSTVIPRLKLEYQLTRSVFVRLVGEYRAFERDSLRDDTRTEGPLLVQDADGIYRREGALGFDQNDFRLDFLFSFQPTPGTVFFAGYGSSLVEQDPFRFRGLTRTRDAFFTKLSYLFRL